MLSRSSVNFNFSDFGQKQQQGAARTKQESYIMAATLYKTCPCHKQASAIQEASQESCSNALASIEENPNYSVKKSVQYIG